MMAYHQKLKKGEHAKSINTIIFKREMLIIGTVLEMKIFVQENAIVADVQ